MLDFSGESKKNKRFFYFFCKKRALPPHTQGCGVSGLKIYYEKEKYFTKSKKIGRKNIRKNIQTEDGMAYLEEDVGDGSGKVKKRKWRRRENGG